MDMLSLAILIVIHVVLKIFAMEIFLNNQVLVYLHWSHFLLIQQLQRALTIVRLKERDCWVT